jgi:DNA helicase TIP49 (TBP-interacting protein)
MFTLHDTFNSIVISRHHTLLNAVRAKRKHARNLDRRNGGNAYVTYAIRDGEADPVDYYDLIAAEHMLDMERR